MSHPNLCATHLGVLLACLRATDGPILELGAGLFSTPLIHAFSRKNRYARTNEQNKEWAERLSALYRGTADDHDHEIIWTPDYAAADITDKPWSVALVDHATHSRAPDLARLKGHAELIVFHDSEVELWKPDLDAFTYRFTCKVLPHTSVVSDTQSLDWLSTAVGDLW
ncbi:MAG: hypothetical protein V1755_06715 [Chloroflexota bacterium]